MLYTNKMGAFREFIEPEILIAEGQIAQWLKGVAQKYGPAIISAVLVQAGTNLMGVDEMPEDKQQMLVQQIQAAMNNPAAEKAKQLVQAGAEKWREIGKGAAGYQARPTQMRGKMRARSRRPSGAKPYQYPYAGEISLGDQEEWGGFGR